MRRTRRPRFLILATVLCLVVSLFSVLAITVLAAPELPLVNSQPRHVTCTALSDQARAYYTGSYTYENLAALPGAATDYDSYAACQDNQLYDALQALMADTQTYYPSYSGTNAGSLAYYWARTDAVSSGSTYVMFYCDEDGSIGSMQREHIWPKSRASYYQKNGGADLHHLRPSYGSLNSAKSNHRFGNIVGVYAGYNAGQVNGNTCYWTYAAADLFECKDDVKGDVARILLYVYVRWGQPNLYTEVSADHLPAMDSDDSQNSGEPVIESLDTLLEWCREDPVDSWEMERNDRIQDVQGNRNVFIDYPELAWLMFGRQVPAGMQTPSQAGCTHQWVETARTAPTCESEGTVTWHCSLCGADRTDPIPALGHLDQDLDNLCDRCGAAMSPYRLSTQLPDGSKALIYYPAGESVLSLETTAYPRVKPQSAAPAADRLTPETGMAVFTVDYVTDTDFYLISEAGYLTTVENGNSLTYTASPDDYSIWYLAEGPEPDTVYLYSRNAVYQDAHNVALEFYSGGFTAYRLTDSSSKEIYTYQLYVDPGQSEEPPFRFDDVQDPHAYYYDPVYWAYNHDPRITNGVSATEFGPMRTCTRGEVVTFLWRAAGCPATSITSCSFRDVSETDFFYEAVLWAVEQGITRGTGADTFSPQEICTRSQVVTFLHRAAESPEPADTNNPFPDVRETDYYYTAVLWAVETGITRGTGDGNFAPLEDCSRAQVVTFLYRAPQIQ